MSQNILHNLIEFFNTLAPAPRNVVAAVSGGADSVALVYLMREHCAELGIEKLAIAHVNHNLRGDESNADEAFVREIANSLQIEFFCKRLSGVCADDSGIENWARAQRYKFFSEIMRTHNFNYAATAHTANDQAETVLMRLARGTGLRGLRGVHAVRDDGVIRPLLNVTRAELENYLSEKKLSYRNDSSNESDNFKRNYVRLHVIPSLLKVNGSAVENIAACASDAARVWEMLSREIDAWVKKFVLRINGGAFHIEKIGFAENEKIAADALVVLFEEHGIAASKLHIDRVLGAVNKSQGEYLMPNNWKMFPREDRLCFVQQA